MGSEKIKMEDFGPDNRDRKIGDSLYRICRNERTKKWYIHEGYNNLDSGEWAIANDFYEDDLEKVIARVNSFTKEKEVIGRK